MTYNAKGIALASPALVLVSACACAGDFQQPARVSSAFRACKCGKSTDRYHACRPGNNPSIDARLSAACDFPDSAALIGQECDLAGRVWATGQRNNRWGLRCKHCTSRTQRRAGEFSAGGGAVPESAPDMSTYSKYKPNSKHDRHHQHPRQNDPCVQPVDRERDDTTGRFACRGHRNDLWHWYYLLGWRVRRDGTDSSEWRLEYFGPRGQLPYAECWRQCLCVAVRVDQRFGSLNLRDL